MKTKNTKTCYRSYENFELDSLAAFLEEQAAEGWELTSKLGHHLGFRRCEPKQVKINVEFVNANVSDYDLEEYADYCKAAGWEQVFSDDKIQIFENADLEAEPISTDPKIKFDTVHRNMRNTWIGTWAGIIVFSFVCWAFFGLATYPTDFMRNGRFAIAFALFSAALIGMAACMNYFRWYRRAKKIVSMGEHPQYVQNVFSRHISKLLGVSIFIYIWGNAFLDAYYSRSPVYFVATLTVAFIVCAFTVFFVLFDARSNKRKKPNTGGYILSSMVVLILALAVAAVILLQDSSWVIDGQSLSGKDDKLELSMEDLGIKTTGSVNRDADYQGSPSLQYVSAEDRSKNEKGYTLWYIKYTTKNPKAYQSVRKHYCEGVEKWEVVDDPAFGAREVFQRYDGDLLLLYPEAVIWFGTTIPLTDEQKEIIGEKLGGEK